MAAQGLSLGRSSKLLSSLCLRCRSLQDLTVNGLQVRNGSNRATVTKLNRTIYPRLYPCLLVNPDGSTINIKYHEPRKILKLPIDLNALTDEEKKARLTQFQPKKKTVIEEDFEDSFDIGEYSHLWKK